MTCLRGKHANRSLMRSSEPSTRQKDGQRGYYQLLLVLGRRVFGCSGGYANDLSYATRRGVSPPCMYLYTKKVPIMHREGMMRVSGVMGLKKNTGSFLSMVLFKRGLTMFP